MMIRGSLVLLSLALMSGCGGQVCPAIYIPIYEVSVLDAVSGEQVCEDPLGISEVSDCTIEYQYSEDGESADIHVSLDGYEDHVEYAVENQTGRAGCFSDPSYTTQVTIYLTPY